MLIKFKRNGHVCPGFLFIKSPYTVWNSTVSIVQLYIRSNSAFVLMSSQLFWIVPQLFNFRQNYQSSIASDKGLILKLLYAFSKRLSVHLYVLTAQDNWPISVIIKSPKWRNKQYIFFKAFHRRLKTLQNHWGILSYCSSNTLLLRVYLTKFICCGQAYSWYMKQNTILDQKWKAKYKTRRIKQK